MARKYSRRKTRKTKKTKKVKHQRGGQSSLLVQFKGKLANGSLFPKNLTKNSPQITFKGPGLYTLIMWDPDAPAKSWLHWLLVNIEEGDIKRGEELVPYAPPTPPSGTHRYYVAMYSQKGPVDVEIPAERGYFHQENFVQENQLLEVGKAMIQVSS